MDVNIPRPNPALTALFKSATMRRIVEDRANTAALLYQSEVAKDTARLATSAHASTEIGGAKYDRWIGVLDVGGPSPLGEVTYAASHEFGHQVVAQGGEIVGYAPPAHDLNRVLEMIGNL